MRLFNELLKINTKQMFQYKAGFLISLMIHPIVFLINIALFTSIYKYNDTQYIKGYSLIQMVW